MTRPTPRFPVAVPAVSGLLVLTGCRLAAFLSATVTVTKAAPIEESDAAANLYHLVPTLLAVAAVAGAVALVASVAAAVGCWRRGEVGWAALLGLAGLLGAYAAWIPARGALKGLSAEDLPLAGSGPVLAGTLALVAACGLWSERLRASRPEFTRCWGIGWRDVPGYLLAVTAGAVITAVPVVLAGILRGGSGAVAGLALSLGGIVLFSLLLGAALAVLTHLRRFGRGRAAVAVTFLYLSWALIASLGAELAALGLIPLLLATLLGPTLFFGVAVGRWGTGVRMRVIAGLALVVLMAVLFPGFFPEVEDFLDRARFFLAALFVFCGGLLGLLACPPNPRRAVGKVVILGAVTVAACAVVLTSGARSLVFQHEYVGKTCLWVVGDLLLPRPEKPKPPAGFKPPSLLASPTRRDGAIMDRIRIRKPPVILILWDACRSDHVSALGYQRREPPRIPTTPVLDQRRDEFLRFTNAFAQSTATTCSLRHLFTARYSSRFMLKTRGVAPFWTNDLARAGYDSFFLNIIGSSYNGIALDAFVQDMPGSLREKTTFTECNRQGEADAVSELLAFLEKRRDDGGEGVFAFIHMDATHTPWRKHSQVPDFGDTPHDRYDSSIRWCDLLTGRLFTGLEKLGMWEDAIVIVTADHGTGLREHGVYGGFHPWRELLAVPLFLKLPGVPGRGIDELVALFDLGPTLCDVFAPDCLTDFEGRSLWPLILGNEVKEEWENRTVFSLSAYDHCYSLVRSDGTHYIRHVRERYEQLHDWQRDPAERRNTITEDPTRAFWSRHTMDWFLNVHGEGRSYLDESHYRE